MYFHTLVYIRFYSYLYLKVSELKVISREILCRPYTVGKLLIMSEKKLDMEWRLKACLRDISESNNNKEIQPLTVGNTAARGFFMSIQ